MSGNLPDDVSAPSNLGLTVRLLTPDEANAAPLALIEGSARALRFVAELLLATAEQEPGFDVSLPPDGPGSAAFSASSDLGLYLKLAAERPVDEQ